MIANRLSLAVLAIVIIAGCTSTDVVLIAAGPQASLANIRGQLAMSQQPDGKQTFAYVILADAHDGLVEKSKQEELRTQMLAGLLGQRNACPKGYIIDKRTETKEPIGMLSYEGHCKS